MTKKKYQFQFSRGAEKNFAALDLVVQKNILKKLAYFEKASDPLGFARPLVGFPKYFRFRIGDYRVIVTLQPDGNFIILIILKIGHRRDVYE